MRIALCLALALATLPPAARAERFVVYYGEDAAPQAFAGYDVIVLDGDHHPPVAAMPPASLVFGYLSLGEVATSRAYYAAARQAGVLLAGNPNWPGSFYVDVRRPAWRALVLDRLAPAVLAEGFSGLFLDTLDDAAFLEKADPKRNAGMVDAAANLVAALHQRFPAVRLVLNRAYEIQPATATDLWGVLGESVLTDYAAATKRYIRQSAADVTWQLDQLRAARAANPALHTFSLDYWNPAERSEIRRLYARERQEGNTPYVATVDLQTIVPEP